MSQTSLPPELHPSMDDDEIDLFELAKTLAEYKRSILLLGFVCFALATGLAFLMTPKYEATVLLAPADDQQARGGMLSQLGGLADLAGVSIGGGGDKDASLAYLTSREFIERFIKEKNLLPVLFDKKWDAAARKWKVADPADVPTLWDGYSFFSKKVCSVESDKKTGLITVRLLWKDRLLVADWANELVKRANDDLRQRSIVETQHSLQFLERELQKTSIVEVQQAIYRVMETQIKSMMMANVKEQFAFKVIDPAEPVDPDGFVKPKRALMMILGLVGGLFVGVMQAFFRKALSRHRENALHEAG